MLSARNLMPSLPHYLFSLVVICVVVLSAEQPTATAEATKNADSRDRSTAVALNYCRASFHRIRDRMGEKERL